MVALSIGSRIRQLRLKQHRTQEEIAGRCGFTKSFLSKIESGKIVPPVAMLVKIAAALGAKESALIEADQNVNAVYTARDEVEANTDRTERGYWVYSFATQHQDKRVQPFLFVARKGEVKEHHLTHEAEEFMYVVEGEMQVQVDKVEYHLQTGCSLCFGAMEVHQVIPVSRTAKYLHIFV